VSARGDQPRSGSLRDVAFERLFHEAFRTQATFALRLQKRQIRKTLLLERGRPVECVSNLRHETLGQFLSNRGRIGNADFKDSLAEAAARQVRIGEVLLERGLLAPAELAEALRQNLAYKLLECFTWEEGDFRFEPWIPDVSDAPAINPARVAFTGITRFVPQCRVTAALGALLERPLVLAPGARELLGELRLSPVQERLVRRLRRTTDPHELFQDGATPRDELARTLYACSVLGLLAPAGRDEPPRREGEAGADDLPVEIDLSELEAPGPGAALCDEIRQEHRALVVQTAREFLGLPGGAPAARARERYLELCRRYAPERFEAPELACVAELAAELLHATTAAYEEVRGRRPAGAIPAPESSGEPAAADLAPSRAADDEGALLRDAEQLAGEYARQAQERMVSGNFGAASGLLALALRSAPDDPASRVQLAYSRFCESPAHAAESLEALERVLEAAPGNALAHLYAAEISHALEAFERAAAHFERGCELWAGEAV
jgi:hypothetical protein